MSFHPPIFLSLFFSNIGNPQQLEQRPITFFRQVLALMDYPDLILDPKNLPITSKLFPEDAISRAKQYLAGMGGSTGAYSHSKGIPIIRRHVADFIHQRDGGEKPNPEHIFLTAGASPGVQLVLQSLIQHPHVGVKWSEWGCCWGGGGGGKDLTPSLSASLPRSWSQFLNTLYILQVSACSMVWLCPIIWMRVIIGACRWASWNDLIKRLVGYRLIRVHSVSLTLATLLANVWQRIIWSKLLNFVMTRDWFYLRTRVSKLQNNVISHSTVHSLTHPTSFCRLFSHQCIRLMFTLTLSLSIPSKKSLKGIY